MCQNQELLLEIKNLTILNNGDPILDNISFNIHRSEIVAILGPSGCGKSTILEAICGYRIANDQSIFFNEREYNKLLKGYLSQNTRLLPWLNLEQNVLLPLKLNNTPICASSQKVEKIFEILEISKLKKCKVTQLSGGEQQRALLARTLLFSDSFFLLDEPFSKLDLALRNRIGRNLRDWWKQNLHSGVVITHAPEDAAIIADKILVFGSSPTKIKKEINFTYNIQNKLQKIYEALGDEINIQ